MIASGPADRLSRFRQVGDWCYNAGRPPGKRNGARIDLHELSVTQAVLDIALAAARDTGARRIGAIHLVIGELGSFVDDSVQFYFDFLSKGTPAEGAILTFSRVPAQALCVACGGRFDVRPPLPEACPNCGGGPYSVTGGRELRVESIEVEDEDSRP
jgi:hydrogenase nickel incorporation protein HypA/HybF